MFVKNNSIGEKRIKSTIRNIQTQTWRRILFYNMFDYACHKRSQTNNKEINSFYFMQIKYQNI